MKNINIGLIGLGTIGTGVVKLLRQNEELIAQKLGAKLVLKKIADINITTPRGVKINKNLGVAEPYCASAMILIICIGFSDCLKQFRQLAAK